MIRTLWGVSNEEESRAYLQGRLTLLYKIMFWAYVLLVASQAVLWEWSLKGKKPAHQNWIYIAAVTALCLMAVLWRGLLVRRRLPFGALYFLDFFYALGSGLVLGMAALFAYDYPPSHYVSLIYCYIAVFARTIIVPSSGRRTMLAGVMLFAPIVIAAIILGASVVLAAPGHVFALGATLLSAVAIALAASG